MKQIKIKTKPITYRGPKKFNHEYIDSLNISTMSNEIQAATVSLREKPR